ncbi:hypothetical protein SAMN06265795_11818 [Noviherbaspirillum humi]|uniref:Uncharacterized protein n=1 Tax=Noviherbaspirillum humi TaxID=1688639 RepID=A0A239KXH7_9BURK|nr:hypothetical protein SAMN06265795_11818 [Noviherbaspirillum humi]
MIMLTFFMVVAGIGAVLGLAEPIGLVVREILEHLRIGKGD